MLSITIYPILQARGVDKPFEYLRKAGFSIHITRILLQRKVFTLRLPYIEKLCILFTCSPHDLMQYNPEAGQKLAPEHPLNALHSSTADYNWKDSLQSMPLNQVKELVKQLKEGNRGSN
jgi:DNA-binding Xre family transcriptional regulator